MKARIQLVEGMTFIAESGSGHAVVVDAAPDVGGRDLGARPMELVLMGAGSCTAIDVVHILRKSRQSVTDCVVELEAERAPEDPKVFTRIHLHYVVTGKGLQAAQVERAIKLSKEKYCSATIMLAKSAEIDFDYEIREAGAEIREAGAEIREAGAQVREG
jgi:putative redox protein